MHSGDNPDEEGRVYMEAPCTFGVDLDNREVVPYQYNMTQGFEEIKPHLKGLLQKLD